MPRLSSLAKMPSTTLSKDDQAVGFRLDSLSHFFCPMKWIAAVLLILLLALQYRLWVGQGSLAEVSRLTHSIEQKQSSNAVLRERNNALDAEVQDLKQGVDAIEERARSELGMVKKDETFFQIVDE